MCRCAFGIKVILGHCVCGAIGRGGPCFFVGYCVQSRGGWIATAHAEWP